MLLKEISQIIKQVTGNVGRKEDIFYRKNEVYMDVIEECNMLLSSKGTILTANVQGKVMMKTFLSGKYFF
jgi:AP-2 complex subunit mu-1